MGFGGIALGLSYPQCNRLAVLTVAVLVLQNKVEIKLGKESQAVLSNGYLIHSSLVSLLEELAALAAISCLRFMLQKRSAVLECNIIRVQGFIVCTKARIRRNNECLSFKIIYSSLTGQSGIKSSSQFSSWSQPYTYLVDVQLYD